MGRHRGTAGTLVRRFYTRTVNVKRAAGDGCERRTMGLVGLHIARRRRAGRSGSGRRSSNATRCRRHGRTRRDRRAERRQAHADARDESAVARAARARAGEAVQRRARIHRAALDGHRTDELRLPAAARRNALAVLPAVVTQWPRMDGNQATPIPATTDGSVPNTFPVPTPSRRSRT